MQFPEKPCMETLHCVNQGFCRNCAPDFSLAVLDVYMRKGRPVETAYREAIHEVKASLAEVHHLEDEADEGFQEALHKLAERCSACGQLLPAKGAESP